MNRTTALLLAMAALLAHALAVHLEPAGHLGQPYEESHAAFRLARNWVQEGAFVWNPGETAESGLRGGLGAHASPLLVAVATVAERVYLPVNRFVQFAGILAALLTVAATTRFATDRSAGTIPALLLVTSGAFAAAAASGTEFPLLAFAATLAFVARERGRPLLFATGLAVLVTARAEGLVLAALLGVMAVVCRPRAGRPLRIWTLGPALAAAVALLLAPDGAGGRLYVTRLQHLVGDVDEGLRYLGDFLLSSITPALLVFPVVALVPRRLGGEGSRALLLAVTWTALVVLGGGGPTTFTVALVPALPLIAIAVQFGIIAALDSRRPGLEPLSWAVLVLGALTAGLPSKAPSEIGWHEAWVEDAFVDPGFGREPLRGRASLQQELVTTAELRDLGRFLREQVDPELSLLTPWSGALGYLADRTVLDVTGRRTRARHLAESLELAPDLILATRQQDRGLRQRRVPELPVDPAWIDLARDEPALGRRIFAALGKYELVTVPVVGERDPRPVGGWPMHLLRHRDLGLAPRVELTREGDIVVAHVRTPEGGHLQLVHLELTVNDAAGVEWSVDPLGRLQPGRDYLARRWLVTGIGEQGGAEAMRVELGRTPGGADVVSIDARLLNPRLRREHSLAGVGEPVSFLVE